MPGPMSAPNGDASLVRDAEKRDKLRSKGQLRTGKSQGIRNVRTAKTKQTEEA